MTWSWADGGLGGMIWLADSRSLVVGELGVQILVLVWPLSHCFTS
jgi:hypothetical protein